ncbi:hypothetical protein [Lichenicoccus sp.]|uniref:hypothetical protein n=1 Tax=Lichenicoccus sp. TaxID=2781899 RepID=UPI003D138F74
MDQPDRPPPKRDYLGLIVLAALLGLIALGIAIFPRIERMIAYQDCVASGHINCGGRTGP